MGVYVSDDDSKLMDELAERCEASIAFNEAVKALKKMRDIWNRSKAATNLHPPIGTGTYKATLTPAAIASLEKGNATVMKIDVPVSVESQLQAAFGLTRELVDKGVRAKVVYFHVDDEANRFDTAEEAAKRGEFMALASEIHSSGLRFEDALELVEKLVKVFEFTRK